MSFEYNNIELMLPKLIYLINTRNSESIRSPSPEANEREIKYAYNEMNMMNSNIEIIKYSYPFGINRINTYCIYMVKYRKRYWIVPYSKYNYNFEIDEYCPIKLNTHIDSLEDDSLSEEVFLSDDNIMDTSNTEVYTSNTKTYDESFKMDSSNVEDSEEVVEMDTSYSKLSYYTNILNKLTQIKNYIIQYEDT